MASTPTPAVTPVPVARPDDGQPWTCTCHTTNPADASRCTDCNTPWGASTPTPNPDHQPAT